MALGPVQTITARRDRRSGVTLVELLIVVAITSLLVAMLVPAVNAARQSARAKVCMNNLRQFGVGMLEHVSRHGTFCTGAFDWLNDGCVTEVGWVADLVGSEINVGEMLCPSNPLRISNTYVDLLDQTGIESADLCGVEPKGNEKQRAPDGNWIRNPCRKILEDGLGPGAYRTLAVEREVLRKAYNTNFTASWLLVRSGVKVAEGDGGGQMVLRPDYEDESSTCISLSCLCSTKGPLTQKWADAAEVPSNFIPLLGDGGISRESLGRSIGEHSVGDDTVEPFTRGPVLWECTSEYGGGMETLELDPSDDIPKLSDPDTGVRGWIEIWDRFALQSYEDFAPIHADQANILFADGSVRPFTDSNRDGVLNNGFEPCPGRNSFQDERIELSNEEIFSGWRLKVR